MKKVILQIKRGVATRYLVIETVNTLSPEAGSWITQSEAVRLIANGCTVVVRKEGQQ